MLHLCMYIQCSTVKRKGKDGRNRKLVESYRDPKTNQPRNRTVQTLEKLPILERSRIIYKYGGSKYLDAQEWRALADAGDLAGIQTEFKIGDSIRGAGNWVLLQYFRTTGLESILRKYLGRKASHVIRDLITLQILDPASKLSYVEKRKSTLNFVIGGKVDYKEDSFYQAMDILENQFENLRDSLHKNLASNERLLLYDLSNSYFCGTKAELGGYGESKEKRYDRYIVSYGLVANEDGLPLDIKVWKGGTADVKTVAATFSDWKKKYQASSAIWVADRSMSDDDTLSQIKQMGLSYITGLPASTQKALLKSIHEKTPELFDQPLSEFNKDGRRYILCRHQYKGYRKEKQLHRHLRKVYDQLKLIRSTPQNKNKEKLYHRAMKVLEKYGQTQCWKISFDTFKDNKAEDRYRLNFKLDRQTFKAMKSIGHFYILQTDTESNQIPEDQVQQHYKSLIKVERCFRQAKSDLEIRPIRHHKARRIRGHIYLNFLALWLVKKMESSWRARQIYCEVPSKLREWDSRMMLHQILDSNSGEFVEWQWNQGDLATQTYHEIQSFQEMDGNLPHL